MNISLFLTNFILTVAPVVAIAGLYARKNFPMSFNVSLPKENTDIKNTKNMFGFSFLVLLKKLPGVFKKVSYYIGLLVLLNIVYKVIKYILDKHSISLFEPFYVKLFSIFGIILMSTYILDYLLRTILIIYYKKNNSVVISNNLPKFLYSYLNELKILSDCDLNITRFYLINLIICIFVLLLLAFVFNLYNV
jgi:hypothetical protein